MVEYIYFYADAGSPANPRNEGIWVSIEDWWITPEDCEIELDSRTYETMVEVILAGILLELLNSGICENFSIKELPPCDDDRTPPLIVYGVPSCWTEVPAAWKWCTEIQEWIKVQAACPPGGEFMGRCTKLYRYCWEEVLDEDGNPTQVRRLVPERDPDPVWPEQCMPYNNNPNYPCVRICE